GRRRQLQRRPVPAPRDHAVARRRADHPHPRRGHQRARSGHRAAHRRKPAPPRLHLHHRRAPAQHHPRRRRNRRHGARQDRAARHARGNEGHPRSLSAADGPLTRMHETPAFPDAAATGRTFLLRLVRGEHASAEDIAVDHTIVIGRDPASATVVLADASVSRRHASVEQTGGGLKLTDLGSGNGVWVGTDRISEVVLAHGDRFRIGSAVFECVALMPSVIDAAVEEMGATVVMPRPTVAAAPEAPPPAPVGDYLVRVVEAGEAEPAGRTFTIGRSATIGRGADCTITLAEKDISRRHARIDITPDGIMLVDLDSTGGTWLDGVEVTSTRIEPGARFRLDGRIVPECVPIEAAPAASPAAVIPPEEDDSTRFIAPEVVAASLKPPTPTPEPARAPAAAPAAAARATEAPAAPARTAAPKGTTGRTAVIKPTGEVD